MENNKKKSLSDLKKNFSDKVIDKKEADALKGGKEITILDNSGSKSKKWNGFGGFIPQ